MDNFLVLLLPLSIILIILIYCFIVIKRHFIDKKPFKGGTEAAVLGSTMELLNKDKQSGIEHIQNMKDEILEESDGEKINNKEGSQS